jgi:hypothetical protein
VPPPDSLTLRTQAGRSGKILTTLTGVCTSPTPGEHPQSQRTWGVKACTEVESAENSRAAVPPAEMGQLPAGSQPHSCVGYPTHRDEHGSGQRKHQFNTDAAAQ